MIVILRRKIILEVTIFNFYLSPISFLSLLLIPRLSRFSLSLSLSNSPSTICLLPLGRLPRHQPCCPPSFIASLRHASLSFFSDTPMPDKLRYSYSAATTFEGYGSKMLATTTTMTFNLPLIFSFYSFIIFLLSSSLIFFLSS